MILAFDGVCVLCNGFVRFLLRRDRAQAFRFASSDSPAGAAIFAADGQDAANPISVVLVEGDQRWRNSEAIIRAVMALGGGWRAAALLRIVPRPIRDAAYRWVARHRYGWFGRTDACPAPAPGWADRFLT